MQPRWIPAAAWLLAVLLGGGACSPGEGPPPDAGPDGPPDFDLPFGVCTARACQPGDFVYDDVRCVTRGRPTCSIEPVGNGCCYQPCERDEDCQEPTRPFCREIGLYDGTDAPRTRTVRVCQEGRQITCEPGSAEPCCNLGPADCEADPACRLVYTQDATGALAGDNRPCFYREPPASSPQQFVACAPRDPDDVGEHEFWVAPIADPDHCTYLTSNAFVPPTTVPCDAVLPLCE